MLFHRLILAVFFLMHVYGNPCKQRNATYGYVCVCNSTYCDTVPPINVKEGTYQQYTTTSQKLGFSTSKGQIKPSSNGVSKHKIDLTNSKPKQRVFGFGGAFTGSTGFNIHSLSSKAQDNLLESYFGGDGIGYTLCRVPIGGTDFSLKKYTYDDDHDGDVDLKYFALQDEDFLYKIPYIKKAFKLSNNTLKLFGTSWTSPPWMKTNNDYAGVGFLKKEYFQTWAEYYVRFFEEYAKNGVRFWGVTTQNEPYDGFLPTSISQINALGFDNHLMNQFISKHLGPTLKKSSFKDLKIMIHDDSRHTLPLLPEILENPHSMRYVDGVAVHWYANNITPSDYLEQYTKSRFKELFLLGTEACNGFLHSMSLEESVQLGSWARAENYIRDIITDFAYGARGWVDWNMVLDQSGGPCSIDNKVDSPVITNNATGEFYKQPMFYAMGHFSKFLRPKSHVLDVQDGLIKSVAVLRPDGLHAVVVFNEGQNSTNVEIKSKKGFIDVTIQKKSINTILF
ncbi:unnamed protein product [Brassicogethes aeneus]|uniref:Glucosylceramidase n=1 Tax=Brassicogethes aeneus TaxID=1431903 RepID=A0A9P0AW14_BRAAE|nr:unnamed protein product [Brassicogethes aeneus]